MNTKAGALVAVATSMAMAPFSITTSGVALAPIGAALGGRLASLQWVVSVFALGFAAMLLPFGSLADRRGRKKVFVAGTILFTVTSVMSAVAPSFGALLVLRAAAGAAAAMSAASGVAILTNAFREAGARKIAFGALGSIIGLGLALGAVAGGPLVDWLGWRVAFVAHVPFAVVSLSFARGIDESRGASRAADYPGAVAIASALGFAIAYGTSGPTAGWTSLGALALLAAAIVSGAAFVAIEARSASPMIELHVFRDRVFSGAVLLALSFTTVWVALFIFVPLYLQVALGRSTSAAGLWMLFMLVPGALSPLLTARLGRRCSPRALLVTGSVLMSLGCFVASMPFASPIARIGVGLVIVGMGAGFVNGLMDYVAVSALPDDRAGVAGGAFNAMRLVGDAVAGVIPGAILTAAVSRSLGVARGIASALVAGNASEADGVPFDAAARQSYVSAMGTLFVVLALVASANAVLSFVAFRSLAPPRASRVASET